MQKSSFLIAGKHAVTEALKNQRRKVLKIFLTEDSKKNLNIENKNKDLLKDIKIIYKTKKALDKLCLKDKILHQGLIAEVEHLDQISIKEYLQQNYKRKDILFVALEDITDPRNIGSIIRRAVSFEVDGTVIVPGSTAGLPVMAVNIPEADINVYRVKDEHVQDFFINYRKRLFAGLI